MTLSRHSVVKRAAACVGETNDLEDESKEQGGMLMDRTVNGESQIELNYNRAHPKPN